MRWKLLLKTVLNTLVVKQRLNQILLIRNKVFNIEEAKYPLEYKKYLKVMQTDVDKLIRQKRNCFGNFGISLFWEEKLLMTIRYLQLWSFTYIAFFEYWPFDFQEMLGNYVIGVGFNFIYLNDGYYDFIEKFSLYLYNIIGWAAVVGLIALFGLSVSRIKTLRHEFKHSKTLLKKWSFNILELLYIPIFVNLVPMLSCRYDTIKNGLSLHE